MITSFENQVQPTGSMSPDIAGRSQQIIREPLFNDGERFVLPYRHLGDAKKFGWFGVGAGLFATLFMISWIGGPLAIGVGLLMDGQLFGLLPVAFSFLGIMGLRFAVLLLVGGWATKSERTRTVLEVRGEKLTSIEEFYWMKWKRKCKLSQIDQLAYQTTWDEKRDSELLFDEVGGSLVAKQEGKEPFLVTGAYPRELLLELAESLAAQFNSVQIVNAPARRTTQSFMQDRQHVEVVEVAPNDVQQVEKPADTNLEIVPHDSGIKIDFPPTGFKSSIGGFSIVWMTFTTLLFGAMFFNKGGADSPVWVLWLIGGLFESVGIAMFVYALNNGRRRTSLVTAGDRLLLVSESLFGKRRNEWSTHQLDEIRVGDSNVSVNDQPIQELQFHGSDGKTFGCLAERTDEELRWLASELNTSLGMQPVSNRPIKMAEVSRDANGRVVPNSTSSIIVEYQNDMTAIRVPARGLKKFMGPITNGLVFIALGVGMAALFTWHERSILDAIIPVGLCSVFAVVGAAILLWALVLAKRGFEFEADLEALQIYRTGWLSKKGMRWDRSDLISVDVIDSGTKINNRSLKLLKIQGNNRVSFSGMTDHSLDDLSMVTIAVNETMALGSSSDME